MIKRKTDEDNRLLKLNLQYFAEGGEPDGGGQDDPQGTGSNDTGGETGKEGARSGSEDGGQNSSGNDNTRTFTQEELDAIIQDRLARERKKAEDEKQRERDEAERKRLEEQEQYKELAQKLQQQLDEQKAEALKAKKTSLIASAGYSEDQIDLLAKLVEGETEDEIKASIDSIKATLPPKPKHVDPSAGNGRKQTPSKRDGEDVGANAWERIKGKIRR